MSHLTLYRKYRSQSFGDLMGQGHIVRSLQNALSRNKQVQAFLFTGPRGTGKTSTARLLAKALNCENGPTPEPCNTCETCKSITDGNCFDVIELDAASESGVEEVREKIVEVAEYPPAFCRYRIIILDEVHDLSGKAFDALLKTVEEPPAHLVFILATTEFQKVPPTIRSRCQKFEFHRGSVQDIADRIKFVADAERIEIEPAAITTLARMADGGFRDALTLLEQAALMADGPINVAQVYDQLGLVEEVAVDRLLIAMKEFDAKSLLGGLDEIAQRGREARSILESMMYRLADLNRSSLNIDQTVDGASAATMHEVAVRIGADGLIALRSELANAHKAVRDVSLPRIWLEAELIRIARNINSIPSEKVPVVAAPIEAKAAVTSTRPVAKVEEPNEIVETPKPVAANTNGTQAAAAPVPSQQETGNETLDEAIRVWKKTVIAVGGPGGSKTLALKLASTKVKSFDGSKLVIAFKRKLDHDGVVSGPSGQAKRNMIVEKLSSAGGENWNIEYEVDAEAPIRVDDEPAVELPAEGKKLQELAREVFPGA